MHSANMRTESKAGLAGGGQYNRPTRERVEHALRDLKSLLGTRATTADSVREHHSHGESYHPAALPDAVCFPHSTGEVSEILKISAKYQVPVIPFGAGTSMEAQVNAIYGGITIDMREMNKVVRISPEDLQATVEAGMPRKQLNKALENTGFTFFIDPGADATIGGMTSTRASGDDGRALRHYARECNGPHRGARLWAHHQDGHGCTQVRCRLRSDSAFCRRRGYARRDYGSHASPASVARSGCSSLLYL